MAGCLVAEDPAIAADREITIIAQDTLVVTKLDTILVGCDSIGVKSIKTEHTVPNIQVDLNNNIGSCLTDLVVQNTRTYPLSVCEYRVREGDYLIDIFEVEVLADQFTSCLTYSKGFIDKACGDIYNYTNDYVWKEDRESCML